MQLAQSFEVAAPIDRVWRALIDIEQVAPCLPGAAVTGRSDDGSYEGSFTVKIGPTSASYTGTLKMLEVDEASHRAMMHASGTVKRGQGGATATIVSKLTESAAGGTHVEVQTEYKITGSLARFGRGGMIEDISERLLREFAGRLAAMLAAPEAAEDVPDSDAGPAEHAAPSQRDPAAAQAPPTAAAHLPGGEPAEIPDMGRIATEALLARAARNWAQIAVIAAVVGYLLGARRRRKPRVT